jgi:hypothetical protein
MTPTARPAFCYQTLEVMALIRERYTGERRRAAVAIYQAMTEVANEQRDAGGRNGFEAPRRRIADYAGVTVRTLDAYAQDFERLGILTVERRRDGRLNLPNLWQLHETPGAATGTRATDGGSANGCATPLAQPDTPPSRSQTHHPGAANSTPVQEGEEVQEPPRPPQGGRARDSDRFREQIAAWSPRAFPEAAQHPQLLQAVEQAIHQGGERTHDGVRGFLARHWRQIPIHAVEPVE